MDYIVYIETIAFSTVIFLAIILSLTIPPKYTKKVLSWLAVLMVVAALGMYGYGYGYIYLHEIGDDTLVISILRTVFDSCKIFAGSGDWEDIEVAYAGYPIWEVLFRTIQLLALTTSASAVIVSLGSGLLKKIRLRILRVRNITLIFGLNDNTLEFGRELAETDKNAILYVDDGAQSELHTAAEQMGAVLRSDPDALAGNERFLKSIGLKPGKRKLQVYALDSSMLANQRFAKRLQATLEQKGILPEQTSLTILSSENEVDNPLQAIPGRYGYGSLISISEPEMVARLLIQSYPPCKSMSFDRTGAAVTDFHAVIIGFGQIGQAVLRQLVMNSQFQGSTSRIAVFSPDYEKRMGPLFHECREMLSHYRISMFSYDGRSRQCYDYLAENIRSINYIVICAGNETINLEIGEQLQPFLLRRNCNAPILMCSSKGIYREAAEDYIVSHRLYTKDILCTDQIDRMAMILNQSYMGKGDMRENWRNCSYFDRMSSRAAADFYGALLHCAGVAPEQALEHWDPQGEVMENLAASEHLRWNAFHYCMGFRPMTEEEFTERVSLYLAEKERDPKTGFRIAKDMDKRLHACMIPWEDLDAYSAKENAITGDTRDYAENDRNNVRGLIKVLRAMK